MKQIPNLFTLLNLFFGCLAIVYILQSGLTLTVDYNGANLIVLPEKIFMASVCIGVAAIVDFFDGFVARLLKASSEMGKQLDSLADVVSFGVAPSLIIYQFLRLSFAQQPDGLDINVAWLFPSFIVACAAAYRLAKFNISTEQSFGFKGVPTPAVGITIAAFPLIYWYSNTVVINSVLTNKWFWYVVVASTSWLMVSNIPLLALKFKNATLKSFMPFILMGIIGGIAAIFFQWIAVPITFVAYVILSQIFKPNQS